MSVAHVPVDPLIREIERRQRPVGRPPLPLRDVLMPGATNDEWTRSSLRQAWLRARARGVLTPRALDRLCGALGIHPSELGR